MPSDIAFVVLAAGKGTRLKSARAKVLHSAGGITLLESVLRAVKPFKAGVWTVVGHQAKTVADVAVSAGARPVWQRRFSAGGRRCPL